MMSSLQPHSHVVGSGVARLPSVPMMSPTSCLGDGLTGQATLTDPASIQRVAIQ